MNYIKKLGISILWIISFFLSLTFIISLFNYFNIINDKIVEIVKILIPITSIFIGGFKIGKKSKNKGWLEGLKLGLVVVIFIVIFNFLALDVKFELKSIIFYIILTTSCVLGSMIGIMNKGK